jgi:hydroxymethylglutaryl-CoA synthase
VDTMNACYGGTNALFNAVQWVESSFWDGRYAVVIAGDIAIYAEGPARPTGGVGACAMLIGPDAPIVLDLGLRGTHMENVYDFYKPNLSSEYPMVDGKLSADCYLRAVDRCYGVYSEKFEKKFGKKMSLEAVDYVVFHAPYNKLVQKSIARMAYNDMLRNSESGKFAPISKFKELGLGEKSYSNPELEKSLAEFSKPVYNAKVAPSTHLPKNLGNSYCAALYAGLVSLVAEVEDGLIGKRIVMFSYGSGLAASMFSFVVTSSVKNIANKMDLKGRLARRTKVEPEKYVQTLQVREKMHHNLKDYTPTEPLNLQPGTFYLTKVDAKIRRSYARTPSATQARL